jgi:TolB-like protein/DNA-binding winged helix-turn-helix (wHTH) protein/Flp pilus assembly protein TadD
LPVDIVRFEDFELDLGRYELRRGDRVVKLEKNPMELLILLVENQGRLVTREEIIQRLWGDNVFVDTRHGINTAVHKLRSALCDDSEEPRILETVVGKGYRLVAAIIARSADPTSPTVAIAPIHAVGTTETPDTPSEPPEPRSIQKRRAFLWAAGTTLTLGVLALLLIPSLRDAILGHPAPIHSLAVLPFENLSGDPSKDYFADGFTEELTTDLAEQTRVLVVSRTSVMRYKGSKKPLPEIARELKVDAIVEGSVVLSDGQVRITAQLIQASTDRHLWAHSYERDRKDLLRIQNEVAATIAGLISTKTEPPASATARSARAVLPEMGYTPETYELSLECRAMAADQSEDSVNRSIQCYQHILAINPNCAPAYATIAYSYLELGLDNVPKARVAAAKAVELDPSLPLAHLVLADTKLNYDKDFAGAEQEYRLAISLNPSSSLAHGNYVMMLIAEGRTQEAVADVRKSQELDPFSGGILGGMILFMAHQYDQAIEAEKSALKYYPENHRAAITLGDAYAQKGMYKEAIAEYEKKLTNDDHGVFLAAAGSAFALSGDTAKAAEVKNKIEHFPATDFVWPYNAAVFFAAYGDKDRAFQWLDKDQKEHDGWLIFLNVDPRLAPLRSDPRFRDLVKRVGLPVS